MSLSAHVRTRVCVILQVFTYDVLFNRLQTYHVQNSGRNKIKIYKHTQRKCIISNYNQTTTAIEFIIRNYNQTTTAIKFIISNYNQTTTAIKFIISNYNQTTTAIKFIISNYH